MNVDQHAESSDLDPMVAPMRFKGDPPVGRQIEQAGRIKWIGAEIVQRLRI